MEKKPLVLVTPPSPFLLDERVFPSLGILKVAAAAEQLGYHVEHLDLNGVQNYEEAVENLCLTISDSTHTPQFGLTATTPQMVAAVKINRVIREALPTSRVILGGPHPTLVQAASRYSPRAQQLLSDLIQKFDVVVAGDGESSIGLAMETESSRLIDADNPKTPLFLTPQRLQELPFPQRSLIDVDSYHYEIDGVRATPLIAQLGCPFGCNFCAGRDSPMLRRARMRPTASVIAEMRHIYMAYGIHGFMFFDDELNVNPKINELMDAICDLQEELGVEFRCRGFVKSELFTEEQASRMYRAGFRRILCGFESGNDRILKNINKRATKDDNTRTMEISHKYNLGMKALMSLGHPGESPETARDTEDWLLSVAPQDFDVTIITAYPGSPYYDKARWLYGGVWEFEVNGDKLYMYDIDYTQVEDFYKGSLDGYRSYVLTDYLTSDDVVMHRNSMEYVVRRKLGIPFNQARPAVKFEHSMGMMPSSVYRRSNELIGN